MAVIVRVGFTMYDYTTKSQGQPFSRQPSAFKESVMSLPLRPAIHPGEVVLEEYLKPLGISPYQLAKDMSVPARRINEIVHGKRAVSADTAIRRVIYQH